MTITKVKICGLSSEDTVEAAVRAGADFVGFVFYPPSPRTLSPEKAASLSKAIPAPIQKVGLFVNPSDKQLTNTLAAIPLDMIQLHGDETPLRCHEIQKITGLPLMKAVRITNSSDIESARAYEDCVSWLLFDAAPPNAELPGGTGESFDWALLQDFKSKTPWMLAGGLNVRNVQQALTVLAPDALDVSSGVENSPGHKNADKIIEFIEAVHKTR